MKPYKLKGRTLYDAVASEQKADNNRVPYSRSAYAKRKGKVNIRAVAEVLEDSGLDPTVEIIRILKDPESDLSPELRLKTYSSLMEYVHSKKRSVEVSGTDGGAIRIANASNDMLLKIAMQDVVDVEATDVTDTQ